MKKFLITEEERKKILSMHSFEKSKLEVNEDSYSSDYGSSLIIESTNNKDEVVYEFEVDSNLASKISRWI